MSLIPDRQLTFSPDLATTIGLEEAILLQGLSRHLPNERNEVDAATLDRLQQEFPFWTQQHIEELLGRLTTLGILPHRATGSATTPPAAARAVPNPAATAEPTLSESWRPSDDLITLLTLNHGIEGPFTLSQVRTFIPESNSRNVDNQFRQHVLAAWRREQNRHQAFEVTAPPAFDQHWEPSEDALEIMARSGVEPEFIDSVRPEFILYWRERGGPPREVNSKFIGWVRQRWVRFQAGLGHSTEPKPMTGDWEPSEQVYEVLALSGIERDYAHSLLPEFRVFWCETGELQTSWGSKFLQHVKHQWRWQTGQAKNDGHQAGRGSGPGDRTRDRSLADDLTDTSWAQ